MNRDRKKSHIRALLAISSGLTLLLPALATAQGSIYGRVANSDDGIPADSELCFFGYLDDTDEEIRIESSVGAGYESGNWYDDFQNYLTEAPGNPYAHHFYNIANGEGYILSKLIPTNSFQEENIILGPVPWPPVPAGVGGQALDYSEVVLRWYQAAGLTVHVYRRPASSDGSFFRIDDPTGNLADPGVTDSFFVDHDVDSASSFDYLVIAEGGSGALGPHSAVITITIADGGRKRGDANGDGRLNIGDCVYIVNYVYRQGPAADPYDAADANCDGKANFADAAYLANFIFRSGPAPGCRQF